jgi:hypothetical protein
MFPFNLQEKTFSSTKPHEENTKGNTIVFAFLRASSCGFVGKLFLDFVCQPLNQPPPLRP